MIKDFLIKNKKNIFFFIIAFFIFIFVVFFFFGETSNYKLGKKDEELLLKYGKDILTNKDILSDEIIICGYKFILGETTAEEIQNKLGNFTEDLYKDKNYYGNYNIENFYITTNSRPKQSYYDMNYHSIRFVFKNLDDEKRQLKDFKLIGIGITRYEDYHDENDEIAIDLPISFDFGYDVRTGITKSRVSYLFNMPISVFDDTHDGSSQEVYEKDGYIFEFHFREEKTCHIEYFRKNDYY